MRFHQNVLVKFTVQLIKALPFLLTNIILVKLLSPNLKGEYEIIILIPTMIVFLFNLGLPACNVYFTAQNKKIENKLVGNTIFSNFVLTIIISILLIFIHPIILNTFYKDVNADLSRVSLLSIFFLFNYVALIRIFEGSKKFIISGIFEILFSYIWLLLLSVVFFLKINKLNIIVFSWLTNIIITSLLLTFFIIKKYSIKLSFSLLKDQINYGIKIHLSNFIELLNYRSDLIMIGAISGLYYTGIYSVGVFIAQIATRPIFYLSAVFFPTISSNTEKQNDNMTPLLTRFSIFFTIVLCIILLALSKIIITLIFDKSYYPSFNTILFLLPGVIFHCIAKILSIDTIGRGKTGLNLYFFLISFILNIFLNLILIPIYNDIGAAIATSISNLISAVLFLIYFIIKRKYKIFDLLFLKKSDILLIINIIKGYIRKKSEF
ncbi:MAG: oligosaccharide flippase family protein [Spirochaetes bacterium]|nr:oligosaccharide flippase family protein [Spirochaetota bacterium]